MVGRCTYLRKTKGTIKLEKRLVEHLRARACEKGEQDAWVTSRHFRDNFKR